jgi:tripartite-type tricarboxylate transporter receptor subunit TctC
MRSDRLPEVPTIGDFVPGYEASDWVGFGLPRNTPADIIDKLNRQINAMVADPKVKARIGLLSWVVPLSRARPPTSASSSPKTPRSGPG